MTPMAFIIEDDLELSDIFAQALGSAAFETAVLLDGRQAEHRLTFSVPDLIVLDLHLPEKSGLDLLREIRADSRFKDTRIIVATADARAAELARDQADLVILKPVSFRQLRELAKRIYSEIDRL